MRVITRALLREFWESRTEDAAIAERTMSAWHKTAETVTWTNWGELKQTFGSADRVGNCVVFDVGNNRYRVIARVMFDKGLVYLLAAMDHQEYDKQVWVETCGCNDPPPKSRQHPRPKRSAPKKSAPRTSKRKG